jgi:hypothetical protein
MFEFDGAGAAGEGGGMAIVDVEGSPGALLAMVVSLTAGRLPL